MILIIVLLGILIGIPFIPIRSFYGYVSLLLDRTHHYYRSSAIFHALGRLLADRKLPKGLPPLPLVEKVSDRVTRILGLNPGSHTLQGTNTYLVGKGEEKILIDTGEDITSTSYVDLLFNIALPSSSTRQISRILLTHGHGDHQGEYLIDILSSCMTSERHRRSPRNPIRMHEKRHEATIYS